MIKVGDLVKFKDEDLNDHDNGKGIVVEVKGCQDASLTCEVYVMWNFLDGKVGKNWSYMLEVIK